jgi:glutathione S-transferase
MYKLYYSPGACSLAIHAVLHEVGAVFEPKEINLAKGGNRTPEFLKLNPRGSVPVLEQDGRILREGAAILIYLAEHHKSPLLPASDSARGEAIEWLCFANSTLHPAYARVFFLRRNEGTDKQFEAGYAAIQKLWDEIEVRLAAQPYIAGEEATLADILIAVIANWGAKFGMPVTLGANTTRMLKAVSIRPAMQQAMKTEGVEYKAA